MTSSGDVINRWAEVQSGRHTTYLRPKSVPIVISADGKSIYSYGYHFPLAEVMDEFVLVNSDSYSSTTSRHQWLVRSAVERMGKKKVLIPFSALRGAGIVHESVKLIDVRDDTSMLVAHSSHYEQVPSWIEKTVKDDGYVHWTSTRHVMGCSVFEADYRVNGVDGHAGFVSGFDENESMHYFLAQLPVGSAPRNYDEALVCLRPEAVEKTDVLEVNVVRQGDVFAIPDAITTRELRTKIHPIVKMGRILNTSHVATEVCVVGETTYARGILWHKPVGMWRRSEHRRQAMGDRKQWHVVVKNTVPEGRSWSVIGRVD